MNIEIKYNPSYAFAIVTLDTGEKIKAEGGSMVSKSPNVSIKTHKSNPGSLLKSLKSAILGGESFWMNTFTSEETKGEVTLAPTLTGDLKEIRLNGTIYIQSTSFMASDPDLEIDTRFQGMKGFISGESLSFLKISGKGPIIISSYGGIEELEINGSFIVDTGHIVAFEDGLNYKVRKFGGWKSFLFSGEGLKAEFKGNGKLWIQSRNVPGFIKHLAAKLPPRRQ